MKKIVIIIFLVQFLSAKAQQSEKFQTLPFGSVKPQGWLHTQMQADIDGFVGNLDKIVPELINDPIYGSERLGKHSKAKDLGNMKEGDAAGDDQYKWWNSETQSNWWDGYLRNVLLLNDVEGISKVQAYVKRILQTQDADGYLGIYDKDLRYQFQSENGELWAKATLYRGLLAYYEYSNDKTVFEAVERAVDNVMQAYPVHNSSPFSSGTGFNGGVSHGLTFTDVLERLFYHTQNEKYREYALFLYRDFSNTFQTEADVQLKNVLNEKYLLQSHGVHTFEHIRTLIIAKYAAKDGALDAALSRYLEKIKSVVTVSGGAIGDEWIAQRTADASHTGYEYCSLQELLDSYCLLLQKTGNAAIADEVENIFYNASQGSRHPEKSCIAYLKTDNSFEMLGTKNGEVEPDRKQTRYKYSAAHQDVAVCCNPNAGRISPYFVQNSWMRENESTLVATLLMPNVLETMVNGSSVKIVNETNYPYENKMTLRLSLTAPKMLTIKIRKPAWATQVLTNERFVYDGDFIKIQRNFKEQDAIELEFKTEVQIKKSAKNEHYFAYGALLYAKSIDSQEFEGRAYASEFTDLTYQPTETILYHFIDKHQAKFKKNEIVVRLFNSKSNRIEKVTLIHFGKTILRQAAFTIQN